MYLGIIIIIPKVIHIDATYAHAHKHNDHDRVSFLDHFIVIIMACLSRISRYLADMTLGKINRRTKIRHRSAKKKKQIISET